MTAPHDAPTAAELIEAVREWIEHDVSSATEGRLKYHARVAGNMLAIVERELALGTAQAAAHRARLDALGVASDAELADAIRAGRFDGDNDDDGDDDGDDDDADDLRALLYESVVDKLRVANPDYLDS